MPKPKTNFILILILGTNLLFQCHFLYSQEHGLEDKLRLDWKGYVKSLSLITQDSQNRDIFSELVRLRNIIVFNPTEGFESQFAYDQEMILGSVLESEDFKLAKETSSGTWLDLDKNLLDNPDFFWRHTLYRGFMKYAGKRTELTVGRQRIAWGVSRLWNPIDLFNPILPQQIERAERVGVDAINGEYHLSDVSKLQLVYAPQDRFEDSSLAGRYLFTVGKYDLSFMLGEFKESEVIGFSFDGYLGDAGLRGEGTLNLEPEKDFVRFDIGYDYLFSNGLYFLLEYFYNGGPKDLSFSERFSPASEIITLKKHFLGLELGYDLTPLLRLDNLLVFDLEGPGLFNGTYLTYSVLQNLDFVLGGQIFWSGEGGEFESSENIYIVQIQWYF